MPQSHVVVRRRPFQDRLIITPSVPDAIKSNGYLEITFDDPRFSTTCDCGTVFDGARSISREIVFSDGAAEFYLRNGAYEPC